MSPRTRMLVIAGVAAAVAAGGTVALAVITSSDERGQPRTETPLAGAPPLVLDLGVRVDPEARALRRAERLIEQKRRPAARRIFERYDSPEAQVGAAFAGWSDSSLATIERLAEERPRDSLVLLHLGYASLWAGKGDEAASAWRRAARVQPDSASAQRADDALHPDFPPGQPLFVPSFRPPPGLARLEPPAALAALERSARGERRPREASLRPRSPAARAPALGPPPVRRRRKARPARRRRAGRSRGRALRQEPSVGGVLPARTAREALSTGGDGALPSRPPAPVAGQEPAGLGRRSQAPAEARATGRAGLFAGEGSKAFARRSRGRTDPLTADRTYGP